MVIDTSALIAILLDEPERLQFSRAIAEDPVRLLSAGSALEASIVVARRAVRGAASTQATNSLFALIETLRIDIEVVTANQFRAASAAYQAFGKGIHPAALNLGDCFAYALAKESGEPILFKGNDFSQTDLASASDRFV